MRVGLLGGTFDPIHCGHLDAASAAREALGLDQIWFIPTGHPPHRTRPVASAAHRFAMVALATADRPEILVSDVEFDTAGPSYTIDTLGRIEARVPSLVGSLVFITGADAFLEIRTWHRWSELLDRCHFAVVSRSGTEARALRSNLPEIARRMHDAPCTITSTPGIFLIEAATANVSSTDVRLKRHDLHGLVPAVVEEYATRHGLYTESRTLETP